jgi:hypothetical protein
VCRCSSTDVWGTMHWHKVDRLCRTKMLPVCCFGCGSERITSKHEAHVCAVQHATVWWSQNYQNKLPMIISRSQLVWACALPLSDCQCARLASCYYACFLCIISVQQLMQCLSCNTSKKARQLSRRVMSGMLVLQDYFRCQADDAGSQHDCPASQP